MEKKRLLVIIGLVVIIVLIFAIGIMFSKLRTRSGLISPMGQEIQKEEVQLASWEDPAGFSFSYPENIAIDPHDKDTENYAHLELTSPDHSGKVFIWVKETDYQDIEAWAKNEVIDANIFDTQLAGEPAKKVAYFDPIMMQVAAIDIDALVLIEMFPDPQGYWQEIYNEIVSSFAFIPLEGEEAVAPGPWEGAGGAGGIIEEPEEVIE